MSIKVHSMSTARGIIDQLRQQLAEMTKQRDDARDAVQPSVDLAVVAATSAVTEHRDELEVQLAEMTIEGEQLRQQLAESKAETQRILEIGKQFERDYRASFEQGCVNLQRAERAEAASKKLAEAGRAMMVQFGGQTGSHYPCAIEPCGYCLMTTALADYSKERGE